MRLVATASTAATENRQAGEKAPSEKDEGEGSLRFSIRVKVDTSVACTVQAFVGLTAAQCQALLKEPSASNSPGVKDRAASGLSAISGLSGVSGPGGTVLSGPAALMGGTGLALSDRASGAAQSDAAAGARDGRDAGSQSGSFVSDGASVGSHAAPETSPNAAATPLLGADTLADSTREKKSPRGSVVDVDREPLTVKRAKFASLPVEVKLSFE